MALAKTTTVPPDGFHGGGGCKIRTATPAVVFSALPYISNFPLLHCCPLISALHFIQPHLLFSFHLSLWLRSFSLPAERRQWDSPAQLSFFLSHPLHPSLLLLGLSIFQNRSSSLLLHLASLDRLLRPCPFLFPSPTLVINNLVDYFWGHVDQAWPWLEVGSPPAASVLVHPQLCVLVFH